MNKERCKRYRLKKILSKLNKDPENLTKVVNNEESDNIALGKKDNHTNSGVKRSKMDAENYVVEKKKLLNRERCKRYRSTKKLSKLNKDSENQVVNNEEPDNIALGKSNLKRFIVEDNFCENYDDHISGVKRPKVETENKVIEKKKLLSRERCKRYKLKKKC